jgi:SAM-dependent methyltransferase
MIAVISLIVLAFLLLLSSLVTLGLTRVPVVRTPVVHLTKIVSASGAGKGQLIVDAGCADGRTLVMLCKLCGASGRGYEMNAPVALAGKLRALFSGRGLKVKVYLRDFFRCDLDDVDVVYCFLMPGVMERVADKCTQEMHKGACLVSFMWEVPGCIPEKTLLLGARADPLYVYRMPVKSAKQADPVDQKLGEKLDGSDS